MNLCIKRTEKWLNAHPKIKEWAWFVLLWLGGLSVALMLAYPIKWLIKAAG